MRLLQLIDSLRPGGAERMAVNYANALVNRIDGSFLCCTRMEGLLKKQLKPEVGYMFLRKKSALDVGAFRRLRRFVKENRIDIIQAHSSSYFLAVILKLRLPGLKLIWHDHLGARALENRTPGLLRPASRFFAGVISVNKNLAEWSSKNLRVNDIRYFPNFLSAEIPYEGQELILKGNEDFKIICLANLRPEKDHLNLLKAFTAVVEKEEQVSLHIIGKDEKDSYSMLIKEFINTHNLKKKVFLYGLQGNIMGILNQADLGVLASQSEGLPMALLEYGQSGLAVVSTDVGDCKTVIGSAGKVVSPGDPKALAEAMGYYIRNKEEREKNAIAFQKQILENFSEAAVMDDIVQWFDTL